MENNDKDSYDDSDDKNEMLLCSLNRNRNI